MSLARVTCAILSTSALLMLPALHAQAAPIVYTSLAAWTAAVSGIQTEDFNASPVGPLAAGSTDIGLFNVFLTTPNASSDINNAGTVNGSRDLRLFLVNAATNIARFDFDAPIVAWGGDFVSTTSGDLLTVTVNGTVIQFDNSLTGSGNGFLGVVDTAPFSSITLDRESHTTFGEFFEVDNFRIADTLAVPDPGSLALLGLGLAGLGISRRRKV